MKAVIKMKFNPPRAINWKPNYKEKIQEFKTRTEEAQNQISVPPWSSLDNFAAVTRSLGELT